jgi:hypothetical protein
LITHPDAEIQAIISTLEEQRDGAVVARAKLALALAASNAEADGLRAEVARLNEALSAAASFQKPDNVIDLEAVRVEEPGVAA